MYGGLSEAGLKKLEARIDALLAGRNANAEGLEEELQQKIGDYSYKVEYHNLMNRNSKPYKNKYGTITPPYARVGFCLANLMANGHQLAGSHAITHDTKTSFAHSVEQIISGNAKSSDIANVMVYDPNLTNLSIAEEKQFGPITRQLANLSRRGIILTNRAVVPSDFAVCQIPNLMPLILFVPSRPLVKKQTRALTSYLSPQEFQEIVRTLIKDQFALFCRELGQKSRSYQRSFMWDIVEKNDMALSSLYLQNIPDHVFLQSAYDVSENGAYEDWAVSPLVGVFLRQLSESFELWAKHYLDVFVREMSREDIRMPIHQQFRYNLARQLGGIFIDTVFRVSINSLRNSDNRDDIVYRLSLCIFLLSLGLQPKDGHMAALVQAYDDFLHSHLDPDPLDSQIVAGFVKVYTVFTRNYALPRSVDLECMVTRYSLPPIKPHKAFNIYYNELRFVDCGIELVNAVRTKIKLNNPEKRKDNTANYYLYWLADIFWNTKEKEVKEFKEARDILNRYFKYNKRTNLLMNFETEAFTLQVLLGALQFIKQNDTTLGRDCHTVIQELLDEFTPEELAQQDFSGLFTQVESYRKEVDDEQLQDRNRYGLEYVPRPPQLATNESSDAPPARRETSSPSVYRRSAVGHTAMFAGVERKTTEKQEPLGEIRICIDHHPNLP